MGIDLARHWPTPMPLKGFSGDIVRPVGTITLFVLAGKAPYTASTMADFIVVKAPSSYNAILEGSDVDLSPKMKFSTPQGLGEIWGKQVLVRECYMQELSHRMAGCM